MMKSTLVQAARGPLALSAITLATLLALTGCNGDDGATGQTGADGTPGQPGTDGTPGFAAANFLIANNGTDNSGTVDLVNQNGAALKRLTGLNNQGVQLDPLGNLIQAGDSSNYQARIAGTANSRKTGCRYFRSRHSDNLTGCSGIQQSCDGRCQHRPDKPAKRPPHQRA